MTKRYAKGSSVKWKWGANWAHGTVEEVFARRVQRKIKGTKIVRNGSAKEPAYLVKQDDGDQALKSQSELERD